MYAHTRSMLSFIIVKIYTVHTIFKTSFTLKKNSLCHIIIIIIIILNFQSDLTQPKKKVHKLSWIDFHSKISSLFTHKSTPSSQLNKNKTNPGHHITSLYRNRIELYILHCVPVIKDAMRLLTIATSVMKLDSWCELVYYC